MGCTCAKGEEDSSHLRNGGHLCCSGCFSSSAVCKACSSRVPVCRTKKCSDCGEIHCTRCLHRDSSGQHGQRTCPKCLVLASGQFLPQDLMAYSVRELRQFLFRMEIAVDNCKEKSDLIELAMQMSCSSEYLSDVSEHTRHVQLLRERMQREQISDARNAPSDSPSVTDASGFHEPPSGNFHSFTSSSPCPVPAEKLIASESEYAALTTEASTLPGYRFRKPTNGAEVESSSRNQMSDEQFTVVFSVADHVEADIVVEKESTLIENKTDLESLMSPDVKTVLRTNTLADAYSFLTTHPDAKEEEFTAKYLKTNEGDKATNHLCLICSQVNKDCVFLECGHMATCYSCGEQLMECPVCHLYISRRVRAFRA